MFPAGAGVILRMERKVDNSFYVPRRRGGDPIIIFYSLMQYACSPQARG